MPPLIPIAVPPSAATDVLENAASLAATQSQLWRFHDEYVLGTRLEVLVSAPSAVLASAAANAARREIVRLNAVFNHRLPESELSELNRSKRAQGSVELFAVVQLSEIWRHITRGAFDGRMGALLGVWSAIAPNRDAIDQAVAALRASKVTLDPTKGRIELSAATVLSLDAIAKGYIVDQALNAARLAAPGIAGIAIGVGGDIRCCGESPDPLGWRIGIPDAVRPAENSPLVGAVVLKNAAIATSGRGPRDCIDGRYRSTTISPFTGRPINDVISASVVASHAADADAIATACMVLSPADGLALVDRLGNVSARITDAHGAVHLSSGWPMLRLAATTTKKSTPEKQNAQAKGPASNQASLAAELRWPNDWELGVNYTAPERQEERSADFRIPYMAMWITDTQNRPVRTLLMVGRGAEWHRDNFIWWGMHRARAVELVDLRSQSTTISGRYPMYWEGMDDNWQPVPLGKYVLHVETSQERGKHYYRSMTIEVGRERFKAHLPSLAESGGVEITYGHYNDRFKAE